MKRRTWPTFVLCLGVLIALDAATPVVRPDAAAAAGSHRAAVAPAGKARQGRLADDGRWTQLSPSVGPGEGVADTAVYDPVGQRMLVAGTYSRIGIWSLSLAKDGETWSRLNPRGRAYQAAGVVAVFDADANRMVVFDPTERNTWALDLADGDGDWRKIAAQGSPGSYRRDGASMVLQDRAGPGGVRRAVLFGGLAIDEYKNDTWILDLAAGAERWKEVRACGTAPPGRSEHAAAYDAAHDRMLVFGGTLGQPEPEGTVWSLDLSMDDGCWSKLEPAGSAGIDERKWVTAVVDACPDAPQILFFGGLRGRQSVPTNEVLRLDITTPGQEAWRRLEPAGSAPPARLDHAAAFDPVNRRMIVATGRTRYQAGTTLSDTWALDIGPCVGAAPTASPTGGAVTPPSDTATPGATTAPTVAATATGEATVPATAPSTATNAATPLASATPMAGASATTTAPATAPSSPTTPSATSTTVDGPDRRIYLPIAANKDALGAIAPAR